MRPPQRLPSSLRSLDTALALLLDVVAPIVAIDLPLADALGCVAADNPPLPTVPARAIAATDGWALASRDLVGASSYAPLPLMTSPAWVEAGDVMPDDCDCVLDADLVESAGPLTQVLGEAIPGQGVRRAGGDIAQGADAISAGDTVRALDLTCARAAGLQTLRVRRPRLLLIDVSAADGRDITAQMIADLAAETGAAVSRVRTTARDLVSIAAALETTSRDLLITIGGSGVGRSDATVQALAQRGKVLAHGLALAPGRTTAIADIAGVRVVALPGAPDQALAGWWTLVLPLLDRLSARAPRPATTLPLARKISSGIGVTEIVLLARTAAGWLPLASGDLSLDAIARADAWFAVPAGSEGHAAGTPVNAYMLRS